MDPDGRPHEPDYTRRLLDACARLASRVELEDVMREVATSVRRDLGYGRCAILVDDRGVGVLTVQGWDGYEVQASRSLGALRLAASDPLPSLAQARGRLVHQVNAPVPELAAAAEVLGLHQFIAFPLHGDNPDQLLGVLLAGSPREHGVAPALDVDGPATQALGDLAVQTGVAIGRCLLQRALGQTRTMLENKKHEMVELMRELREREGSVMGDLLQAQRFQQSIMARAPEVAGASIEVVYRPLDMVGGDLYDVTAIDEGRLRIFIADATGHGIAAALTTMFIKSEYEIIKRTVKGPVGVLRVLNERIARTYQQLQMRFTAICLNFDMRSGTLSWASAAHPSPCLVRDGALTVLEGGGPFMGLLPDVSFPEHKMALRRGDGVYAYTDGLTEAWNPAGEAFGDERLHAAICDAVAGGRPAGAAACLAVDQFVGGDRSRSDDITFVGIRWNGSSV